MIGLSDCVAYQWVVNVQTIDQWDQDTIVSRRESPPDLGSIAAIDQTGVAAKTWLAMVRKREEERSKEETRENGLE